MIGIGYHAPQQLPSRAIGGGGIRIGQRTPCKSRSNCGVLKSALSGHIGKPTATAATTTTTKATRRHIQWRDLHGRGPLCEIYQASVIQCVEEEEWSNLVGESAAATRLGPALSALNGSGNGNECVLPRNEGEAFLICKQSGLLDKGSGDVSPPPNAAPHGTLPAPTRADPPPATLCPRIGWRRPDILPFMLAASRAHDPFPPKNGLKPRPLVDPPWRFPFEISIDMDPTAERTESPCSPTQIEPLEDTPPNSKECWDAITNLC